MCFLPNRRQLAVTNHDGNGVRIWDWDSGKLKVFRTLEGHASSVWNVAYSPDGKWLASSDLQGFKLWDAETLQEIRTVATPRGRLDFTPDSRTLYVAPLNQEDERDYAVTRWDVAGKERLPALAVEGTTEIRYSCLSRDGKVLFLCAVDTASFVRTLDTATGKDIFPRR